ncbi:hypothetical protein A5886_001417 [Enterococcus sp. 8G7_MSG3316]|uniref:Uncharacterized protein n=1 Tax=Candidatus Enterococcus testudinis TaxID=1834191 RepID=A0A242A618_9ENTE|nr:hypothetical protein [Enterococcus sp. 8G7_MSG3316]OTN76340.1 hypothetical protein A5886_001417 [Enterococcus sp. 8G7_MSG3316]
MKYDDLIDVLYETCSDYDQLMSGEKQADRDLLQKLLALNFDVRRNGIKGLGDTEVFIEDDVRLPFEDLISEMEQLSSRSRFSSISELLDRTREDLLENGIDGLIPSIDMKEKIRLAVEENLKVGYQN